MRSSRSSRRNERASSRWHDPRALLGPARRTRSCAPRPRSACSRWRWRQSSSRGTRATHEMRFLPAGSNGIVVLDLSASISSDTYSRIGADARRAEQEPAAATASSSSRTAPTRRCRRARRRRPSGRSCASSRCRRRSARVSRRRFPVNPWTDSFSAGTRISTGLDLARSILIGEKLARPAVLLVSDLDDDPSDLPNLGASSTAYRQEHIRLNVVGLNPSHGRRAAVSEVRRGQRRRSRTRAAGRGRRRPRGGCAVSVGAGARRARLVALLALNELWTRACLDAGGSRVRPWRLILAGAAVARRRACCCCSRRTSCAGATRSTMRRRAHRGQHATGRPTPGFPRRRPAPPRRRRRPRSAAGGRRAIATSSGTGEARSTPAYRSGASAPTAEIALAEVAASGQPAPGVAGRRICSASSRSRTRPTNGGRPRRATPVGAERRRVPERGHSSTPQRGGEVQPRAGAAPARGARQRAAARRRPARAAAAGAARAAGTPGRGY